MIIIMLIQISFPETLITSIGVTVSVLGAYMNLEDPSIRKLSQYHDETVMAFATLIESRDNNTGGHVKRTSMYVKLIAEELRRNDKYQDILTKDYVANLIKLLLCMTLEKYPFLMPYCKNRENLQMKNLPL